MQILFTYFIFFYFLFVLKKLIFVKKHPTGAQKQMNKVNKVKNNTDLINSKNRIGIVLIVDKSHRDGAFVFFIAVFQVHSRVALVFEGELIAIKFSEM